MERDFSICIQDIKKKLILNDQLYGFDDEQKELLQIVKKTTDFGESDSVIIFGPNKCGKSLVICLLYYLCNYYLSFSKTLVYNLKKNIICLKVFSKYTTNI